MSIKTRDGKRVSNPATEKDSTEVRGMNIGFILQRENENGEKEIVILDEVPDQDKVKKPVMNGVISTQMKKGMVIHTEEYMKKAKEKASQSVSVNDGSEIGE